MAIASQLDRNAFVSTLDRFPRPRVALVPPRPTRSSPSSIRTFRTPDAVAAAESVHLHVKVDDVGACRTTRSPRTA